jgi:hypothetical protein
MKTIKMICVAAALCVPALASAQRGGGAVAVGVQRVDTGRTIAPVRDMPVRDIDVRRGDIVRGAEVETGTRIRRPQHSQARRRWNAAHPPAGNAARRRYYNATH